MAKEDLSENLSFKSTLDKSFSSGKNEPSLIGNTVVSTSNDESTISNIFFYSNEKTLYCCTLIEKEVTALGSIELSQSIVRVSASYDNRLVLVCTIHGSIHCYNVVKNGSTINQRWSEEGCITTPMNVIPVLSFAPHGYNALIIDNDNYKTCIIDASLGYDNICNNQVKYSYGCWCPVSNTSNSMNLALCEAISGIIRILSIHHNNVKIIQSQSIHPPKLLVFLPIQKLTNVWRCNHLLWYDTSNLLVGYCRITPKGEVDEEEDENDHETLMYIATLDSKYSLKQFVELGEVCPYFIMPKGGRYVYYSCYIPILHLVCIGCNVSNEVVLLGKQNKMYQVLNIDVETDGISAPLDPNDEYSNVIGLTSTIDNTGKIYIVLASTDGKVSCFDIAHKKDDKYAIISPKEIIIPEEAVVGHKVVKTPVKIEEPAKVISPSSFDVQAMSPGRKNPKPPIIGNQKPFTFGQKEPVFVFGQKESKPVFGNTPFGQTFNKKDEKPLGNTPVFGQTSSFGTPAKPIFGQTTPVFGQTSSLFTNTTQSSTPVFGQTSSLLGSNDKPVASQRDTPKINTCFWI